MLWRAESGLSPVGTAPRDNCAKSKDAVRVGIVGSGFFSRLAHLPAVAVAA